MEASIDSNEIAVMTATLRQLSHFESGDLLDEWGSGRRREQSRRLSLEGERREAARIQQSGKSGSEQARARGGGHRQAHPAISHHYNLKIISRLNSHKI